MADTKLKRAMRERGVTAEQLADRLGMQGAALRRYVRGEIKPNIDLAQQIAQALEMDEGELWDVATTANNGRTVPVYGSSAAGQSDITDLNTVLEYESAPPNVRGAAYGVLVAGSEMQPRLTPGDTVFVSPGRPLRAGDLVVVQMKENRGPLTGVVREYVSHNSKNLEVRTTNSRNTITYAQSAVIAVHKVVAIYLY